MTDRQTKTPVYMCAQFYFFLLFFIKKRKRKNEIYLRRNKEWKTNFGILEHTFFLHHLLVYLWPVSTSTNKWKGCHRDYYCFVFFVVVLFTLLLVMICCCRVRGTILLVVSGREIDCLERWWWWSPGIPPPSPPPTEMTDWLKLKARKYKKKKWNGTVDQWDSDRIG